MRDAIEASTAQIIEVPLLVEKGWEKDFDCIWVVTCPREMQIERLMQRGNWTPDIIERVLGLQATYERRREVATRMIYTRDSLAETYRQVVEGIRDDWFSDGARDDNSASREYNQTVFYCGPGTMLDKMAKHAGLGPLYMQWEPYVGKEGTSGYGMKGFKCLGCGHIFRTIRWRVDADAELLDVVNNPANLGDALLKRLYSSPRRSATLTTVP